jgi:tetratricopeptide (TPR) repeat protein
MASDSIPEARAARFRQLISLRRYADAEREARAIVGDDPEGASGYECLARALHCMDRDAEALPLVLQALAREPESVNAGLLHAAIVLRLDRPEECLRLVGDLLAKVPYESVVYELEAAAFLRQGAHRSAELSAKKALALDASNIDAANLLAVALRLQGKRRENEETLTALLLADPENPQTHANAGWAALERGERENAEKHFREGLRLDPESESAREGLLNSFKARSFIFRAHLKWAFFMEKLSGKSQIAMVIGIYLASKLLRSALGQSPWAIAVGVLYFLFVLWNWVARGFGNFLILCDSSARRLLRRGERLDGLFVGGGVTLGVAALVLATITQDSSLGFLGATLVASTIPASLVFLNASILGRWLFGGIALYAYATGLGATLEAVNLLPGEKFATIWVTSLGACMLCTWLGLIPFLRKSN